MALKVHGTGKDVYGDEWKVQESSLADDLAVWVHHKDAHGNDVAIHLTHEGALDLIDALKSWDADIQSGLTC